jgi:hypothetical protein
METPSSYKDIFGAIAADSDFFGNGNEINSFHFGNVERLQTAMRSDISYPAMWVELPDYGLAEMGSDDNMTYNVQGAFLILMPTKTEDYQTQDEAFQKCHAIALQVIKVLRAQGFFSKGDYIPLNPVDVTMVDGCSGYRAEIKIKLQESTLFN